MRRRILDIMALIPRKLAFVAALGGTLIACEDYILGPLPVAADPTGPEVEVNDVDAAPPPPSAGERGRDAGRPDAEAAPTIPPWEMPPASMFTVRGNGHVLFLHPDGEFRRVEAVPNATIQNVSQLLNAISPGVDSRMTQSEDGDFLLAESTRFGCTTPCLSVFTSDLKSGSPVRRGTATIQIGSSPPVIGAGGRLIVFAAPGAHNLDLYSITRPADATRGWSAAKLLTGASPKAFNHRPSLSPDQTKVTFDCGADANGDEDTDLCEVGVNGTNFRLVAAPKMPFLHNLHNPSLDRNGTLVTEGEGTVVIDGTPGNAERIFRISGTGDPVPLAPTYTNDNTPCVLPNGNIASLWLGRVGNPDGNHELKIMKADGTYLGMIVQGFNIQDIGLTCGN